MGMFARLSIFLACFYFRFCTVDCSSNPDLTSADDYAIDNALDYGDSYYLTGKANSEEKCNNGLCEPFELCREEEDSDSGETFAMCECVDGDDRCNHAGIPRAGSEFDALAVERFTILQQRSSISSCSLKCRLQEICLSIRGHEICLLKRGCDKESKPCHNGGRCRSIGNGGSACRCPKDFFGDQCEINMTICSPSNPCRNKGLCEIVDGGQSICECKEGWQGDHCEEPADPCLLSPCPIDQSCIATRTSSGKLSYNCVQLRRNACVPNPCQGDCQCKASCKHEGGYLCRGKSGLLGKNCDIPAPKISCGADTITIGVDARIMEEYNGGKKDFVMFMSRNHSFSSSTGCTAIESAGFYNFSVSLPFLNCGMVVTAGDDVTRVAGKIWLNRFFGMAEMAIPVVEFLCRYEKQYRVVTSLVPAIDRPTLVTEHGILRGSATVELCKTGSYCPRTCPEGLSLQSGAIYTVNERIHIRIMPGIKKTQLRLTDLYLSCSANSTQRSPAAVDLLTKSCLSVATSRSLSTRAANAGAGVCLSFRTPLLKECSQFYIHARLDECYSKCDTTYRICSTRPKRSVEYDQEHVFGPIYILDAHDGVLESVLYPGDDDAVDDIISPSKTGRRPRHPSPLITLAAIFIVAVVILSLVLAYDRCSVKYGKMGLF